MNPYNEPSRRLTAELRRRQPRAHQPRAASGLRHVASDDQGARRGAQELRRAGLQILSDPSSEPLVVRKLAPARAALGASRRVVRLVAASVGDRRRRARPAVRGRSPRSRPSPPASSSARRAGHPERRGRRSHHRARKRADSGRDRAAADDRRRPFGRRRRRLRRRPVDRSGPRPRRRAHDRAPDRTAACVSHHEGAAQWRRSRASRLLREAREYPRTAEITARGRSPRRSPDPCARARGGQAPRSRRRARRAPRPRRNTTPGPRRGTASRGGHRVGAICLKRSRALHEWPVDLQLVRQARR